MARTQKNKATEYHLGQLKARLAKLRTELQAPASKGGAGEGFDVSKYGDGRVALIGFPSVGKSSLLTMLTGTESEAAAYEFTTLTCIPGVRRAMGRRSGGGGVEWAVVVMCVHHHTAPTHNHHQTISPRHHPSPRHHSIASPPSIASPTNRPPMNRSSTTTTPRSSCSTCQASSRAPPRARGAAARSSRSASPPICY